MRDDYLFCKIISGKLSSIKIYEDASVFAFLDIYAVRTIPS